MFSRSYIKIGFVFAIRTSIAATARKFTDYLLIKTTTKWKHFLNSIKSDKKKKR